MVGGKKLRNHRNPNLAISRFCEGSRSLTRECVATMKKNDGTEIAKSD
jgi:hypothetical protein